MSLPAGIRGERWPITVAAVVLLVALAGVAVGAVSDDKQSGAGDGDWQPDVPDVASYDLPGESGVATVGDETYDSVQEAVDDAEPGETVVLEGHFEEHVTVTTPGLTITSSDDATVPAAIDGGGEGTVFTIHADDVTVEGVWITGSGFERSEEDAGVFVNGTDTTLSDVRITDVTYGVWVDGVPGTAIEHSIIAGHPDVYPHTNRGNGIHLWAADDAELRDNHVTQVRDGIYYSWADRVVTENNVLWDLRYGVHYMYSQDNRLEGNLAFDNDVGFALMVSENLVVANNTAIDNEGSSGHGILVKDIDNSEIRDNVVVRNHNGIYVYNSHGNVLTGNLVAENEVGITVTAGSSGETVARNTVADNDLQAFASSNAQVAWNDSAAGNYWSNARPIDLDSDGTSEIRHQPAGAVETLVHERPETAIFAESPAADVVRLAESSFPVVGDRGVVDHHPLVEPPHGNWSEYYGNYDH